MTKTEAIIQLRLGPGINEDVSEKYNDAVNIAIEALQTPPISQRSMYQAGYRQGREEALKQVTSKLNNPDDSLLTADSEVCKEQKSKLDLISRAEAYIRIAELSRDLLNDDCINLGNASEYLRIIRELPSADRPRGEWISKEELIDAINDAKFVYDGDEDGHKEHDISELVRITVKGIIDNLSAKTKGEA